MAFQELKEWSEYVVKRAKELKAENATLREALGMSESESEGVEGDEVEMKDAQEVTLPTFQDSDEKDSQI